MLGGVGNKSYTIQFYTMLILFYQHIQLIDLDETLSLYIIRMEQLIAIE